MFEQTRRLTPLAALFFAGAMLACGGGDAGSGGETGGAAATGGGAATATTQVTNGGTIAGVVNFAGDAPAMPVIDMSEEPTCADKHTTPQHEETVVVNNGKLKNVFIYLKEGLTGSYAAPPPTTIDQQGCIYIPHVVGVMVGESLEIKNSDGILHNIHTQPTNNREFNRGQPTTMTSETSFSQPEVMIPVKCDVHGWMHAYIGVVANPYFAVSGDDGSFSIANVPPGTYTVEAWHEKYGVQTGQAVVEANGSVTLNFDYNASMAKNAVVPMGEPIDLHDHGTPVKSAASGASN
jgi:Carboxypeptidase regulatory-like domain